MGNKHKEARQDMDLAAAGERMVDLLGTRAHLRRCKNCQDYFNKLGAEGRHREGGGISLFERSFSEQTLEAFIASLPPMEQVQEERTRKRRRRRYISIYAGCFLGGVAAMLLYLLLQ